MAKWLEDIETALDNLDGIAHYDELYPEVARVHGGPLPITWKQIIRRTIQDHSRESNGFRGPDVFYSVKGIGSGVWGLHARLRSTPKALDMEEVATPNRVLEHTFRILRDTELSRKIKALHKNICQVCGATLPLSNGETYAEAHHIQPLGSPHNGPDVAENIVVLCPNHHALFDYRAMRIVAEDLRVVQGHVLGPRYVAYHNDRCRPSNC